MKKVISLLLALLFVCTAAYAEAPDLSAMTLDELLELHKLLDTEIDARIGCEPDIMPAGVYVAGESIAAGGYVISANEDHFGITVATFANVETYEQAMAEQNEALIAFQNYLSKGDSAFVQLEEGMVLLVSETALIEVGNAAWML